MCNIIYIKFVILIILQKLGISYLRFQPLDLPSSGGPGRPQHPLWALQSHLFQCGGSFIQCFPHSPIENSPFQNSSSSIFSTSGFRRLFFIRIFSFSLQKWDDNDVPDLQIRRNSILCKCIINQMMIGLWAKYYLLGGGRGTPGLSSQSSRGS